MTLTTALTPHYLKLSHSHYPHNRLTNQNTKGQSFLQLNTINIHKSVCQITIYSSFSVPQNPKPSPGFTLLPPFMSPHSNFKKKQQIYRINNLYQNTGKFYIPSHMSFTDLNTIISRAHNKSSPLVMFSPQ